MSTSRFAVVRRLSRVLLFPLHGQNSINNRMRRRQGNDPTSTEEQRICTKENCLTCCKKFTAFMFSRVGLFFVMMGYVALGGALFQALEAGNEHNMRRIMDGELTLTLNKLWNETLRVNSFPEKEKKGNFSVYASGQLEQFEATVIRQVQQGFDGRTIDSDHDWNYFGAVLYAVTLISTIGYGHITTKTTQGKIATILYSAFGVPLMMLFVANIGSTMAKMFSFVFTRMTMLICCRMSNKKKRASLLKKRQKLNEKNNPLPIIIDGKLPISISNEEMKEVVITSKTNLKPKIDENIKDLIPSKRINPSNISSTTTVNLPTDLRQLPADIRLDMLTGIPNSHTSYSIASSINSVGERSKDAILRMNELIRQNSAQDIDELSYDDEQKRQPPVDINAIEYYINETNKLTSNLDSSSIHEKSIEKDENMITNLDENDMKQVAIVEESSNTTDNDNDKESKDSSKKSLKRSKSESTHNRQLHKKGIPNTQSINDNESPNIPKKPARRRFFSRKNDKLKKQAAVEDETTQNLLHRQTSAVEIRQKHERLSRKSLSFNEPSTRILPPPPDYEQSTTSDITPLPSSVTWKGENQFYPTDITFDLTNSKFEDDEDEEMAVPLLVTVFVIPLYLVLGAILFSIWEQWSFLNSFYFCFITITTIGFGDFVPGASLKVGTENEKLISAAVYILFGLVLIAMCVNLMKEQLSQKVKRVANKLGNF